MQIKSFVVATATGAALAGLLWLTWPRAVPRAAGPMPQQVYVWQRAWTEPVRQAIATQGSHFAELIPLAAELTWQQGKPKVVPVALDYAALRRSGRRIGLALRVGPFGGPFAREDWRAHRLADLANSIVAQAASNQLALAELQIDFDCAASKLAGYRWWVQAIRERIAPLPVTLTALPSWLKRRGFRSLAAASHGFVLQVHSLERPRHPDAPFGLCDPQAARRAVERAARFGQPFRVALPTYGYWVAFDAAGKFIGLSAEGPALNWPSDVQLREVRADPSAMADLVRKWTTDRPELLAGILWYRLPVAGDQLNWSWPTLATVMQGTSPKPLLATVVRHPAPALAEIDLENRGTADFNAPVRLRAHWTDARLLASDGVAGFEVTPTGRSTVELTSHGPPLRLTPGQKQLIGWLRLETNAEVKVKLMSHETPK